MKLIEIFTRLLKRSNPQPHQTHDSMLPGQSREMLKNLLRRIEITQEIELSCDETYELLDRYAEMVVRGENPAQLLPLVKHHLEMCPDCHEELEALLSVLQNTPAN